MKKFFYACVAILCIVLSYHFGATNAQGQSPMAVRWVGDGSDPFFATSSGLYVHAGNIGWRTLSASGYLEPPIPVDAILYYTSDKVVSTSGEAFYRLGGQWVSRGFIPDGPTPTTQQSWGQLKARYR